MSNGTRAKMHDNFGVDIWFTQFTSIIPHILCFYMHIVAFERKLAIAYMHTDIHDKERHMNLKQNKN